MTKPQGYESPEYARMLAEEQLIFDATELIAEAMDRRGINRKQLADMLGVSPGEITQRMSGTRNLTLRSLASMLHALDARADLTVNYSTAAAAPAPEYLFVPMTMSVTVTGVGSLQHVASDAWQADANRAELSLAA